MAVVQGSMELLMGRTNMLASKSLGADSDV